MTCRSEQPVDEGLKVDGLADLQKALRQIDRDLPRELAVGLAGAAEIVADEARRHVPVLTGKAKASIKVRKSQRAAALAVGGNKAPWYPWLDFGGRVGPGRTGPRTGSVQRDVLRGGRYIYPALETKEDAVKAEVDQVLERLARKAGFEQEGRGY